jgi:hypothetical protein
MAAMSAIWSRKFGKFYMLNSTFITLLPKKDVGCPKIRWSPQHQIPEQRHESNKEKGTRNPRNSAPASKVMNPFTHALATPFIQRRRDLYIPRLPSNLKNIPDVNTYINVF